MTTWIEACPKPNEGFDYTMGNAKGAPYNPVKVEGDKMLISLA